jgi:hypothetical protein
VNQLKTAKLQNIQGENVTKLTSIVRNTVRHLETMKDATTNLPLLPTDLNEQLLSVLQTSSVTQFNNVFTTIENNARADALGGSDPKFPSLEELCAKADANFQRLSSQNKWTGVRPDGSHLDATFVAKKNGGGTPAANVGQKKKNPKSRSGKQLVCDNCGSDEHFLNECKHARDESKIAAAKKRREDAKKKEQSGRGPPKKWAPPTDNEVANGSKRLIDGKLFKFDDSSKRWNKLNANIVLTPAPAPAPAPAGPPTSVTPGPSGAVSAVTGGSNATSAEARAAAIASLSQLQDFLQQHM